MGARRTVELVGAKLLAPGVRGLTFRCVDNARFEFAAGQWVDVFVSVGPGERHKRAYSIASGPGGSEPGQFELAVTLVEGGRASHALHGLELGARVEVEGPHGFFTRDAANEAAFFVGTGTGLCPLRAMIVDALQQPASPPMTLLFGCRAEADVLWREELTQWQQSGRVAVHVTLSRPAAGWTGRSGYVQTHLAALLGEAPRPHVYICGLNRMVAEVRRVLKQDLKFDRRLVHSERYD